MILKINNYNSLNVKGDNSGLFIFLEDGSDACQQEYTYASRRFISEIIRKKIQVVQSAYLII